MKNQHQQPFNPAHVVRGGFLLVLIGLLILPLTVLAQQQEALHGPWRVVEMWGENWLPGEGAWRTENIQPSLFLFTEGYYSITYVFGEERRPQMAEDATREGLTPEQASSVWIPFISNAGTYEITPTTITTHPIAALWPNFMEGGSEEFTYRLEAGVLTLTLSGEGWSWNARLERY